MIVAVDTSVVVAALSSWHEEHETAARALNRLLAKDELVLPQHVLMEAYSVLTRLPAPHRISAHDAHRVLFESFEGVTLAPLRKVWPLISEMAGAGVVGGQIYDAGIARAAREARADAILTLNRRDFEVLGTGLQVLSPE